MAKVIQLKKIKVGAVSYLNTKPFLYGFEKSGLIHDMDLSVDYPAAVARKLKAREIDMALLPVAVLPILPSYYFVGDYGIACDGEVASVALFSNVPLEQIDTILLDYQSRTSAALLR
ncbi:MAG: MqnA/MqnD/SBP family protein, partial [Chitinophagaceae bacterium]